MTLNVFILKKAEESRNDSKGSEDLSSDGELADVIHLTMKFLNWNCKCISTIKRMMTVKRVKSRSLGLRGLLFALCVGFLQGATVPGESTVGSFILGSMTRVNITTVAIA